MPREDDRKPSPPPRGTHSSRPSRSQLIRPNGPPREGPPKGGPPKEPPPKGPPPKGPQQKGPQQKGPPPKGPQQKEPSTHPKEEPVSAIHPDNGEARDSAEPKKSSPSAQQIMRARYREQMIPPRTWRQAEAERERRDRATKAERTRSTATFRAAAAQATVSASRQAPSGQRAPEPAALETRGGIPVRKPGTAVRRPANPALSASGRRSDAPSGANSTHGAPSHPSTTTDPSTGGPASASRASPRRPHLGRRRSSDSSVSSQAAAALAQSNSARRADGSDQGSQRSRNSSISSSPVGADSRASSIHDGATHPDTPTSARSTSRASIASPVSASGAPTTGSQTGAQSGPHTGSHTGSQAGAPQRRSHANAAARASASNPINVAPRVPSSAKFVSTLTQASKREQEERKSLERAAQQREEEIARVEHNLATTLRRRQRERDRERPTSDERPISDERAATEERAASEEPRSYPEIDFDLTRTPSIASGRSGWSGASARSARSGRDSARNSAYLAANGAVHGGSTAMSSNSSAPRRASSESARSAGSAGTVETTGSSASSEKQQQQQRQQQQRLEDSRSASQAAVTAGSRMEANMASIHMQVNAAVQAAQNRRDRRAKMKHYSPAATWSAPSKFSRMRSTNTDTNMPGGEQNTPHPEQNTPAAPPGAEPSDYFGRQPSQTTHIDRTQDSGSSQMSHTDRTHAGGSPYGPNAYMRRESLDKDEDFHGSFGGVPGPDPATAEIDNGPGFVTSFTSSSGDPSANRGEASANRSDASANRGDPVANSGNTSAQSGDMRTNRDREESPAPSLNASSISNVSRPSPLTSSTPLTSSSTPALVSAHTTAHTTPELDDPINIYQPMARQGSPVKPSMRSPHTSRTHNRPRPVKQREGPSRSPASAQPRLVGAPREKGPVASGNPAYAGIDASKMGFGFGAAPPDLGSDLDPGSTPSSVESMSGYLGVHNYGTPYGTPYGNLTAHGNGSGPSHAAPYAFPAGSTPSASMSSGPRIPSTSRSDGKRNRFNEDKPWKGHRSQTDLTDRERKRYESSWVSNRGTHSPYLAMPEADQAVWEEAVASYFQQQAHAQQQQMATSKRERSTNAGPLGHRASRSVASVATNKSTDDTERATTTDASSTDTASSARAPTASQSDDASHRVTPGIGLEDLTEDKISCETEAEAGRAAELGRSNWSTNPNASRDASAKDASMKAKDVKDARDASAKDASMKDAKDTSTKDASTKGVKDASTRDSSTNASTKDTKDASLADASTNASNAPTERSDTLETVPELAPIGEGHHSNHHLELRDSETESVASVDSELEDSEDPLIEVAKRAADIHGYVVARSWRRSRSPEDILGQIWELVDTNKDGTLDRSGFVIGMWLCDQCLYGRKSPAKVTPELWQSAGKSNLKIRVKPRKTKIGRSRKSPGYVGKTVGYTVHSGRNAVKKAVQTATS